MDTHTDRQKDRHRHRKREADRLTEINIDRWTHRQRDRQTQKEREADRWTCRYSTPKGGRPVYSPKTGRQACVIVVGS